MVQDTALAPCVDTTRAVALGAANRREWSLLPGSATARCLDSGAGSGEGPPR
jgi:hypothetical protein